MARPLTRTLATVLLASSLALGCGPKPAGPTAPASTFVAVWAISPDSGSTVNATSVTITGRGFQPGATVTLGAAATNVAVLSTTTITATVAPHAAATVDVIVINPGGGSGKLPAAFAYTVEGPYIITATPDRVTAGDRITVTWTAPIGGTRDWIGLFRPGDSNEDYGWYEYTNGALSGTLSITAPNDPGRYEFRYLPNDGWVDTARSSTVTIVPRTPALGGH